LIKRNYNENEMQFMKILKKIVIFDEKAVDEDQEEYELKPIKFDEVRNINLPENDILRKVITAIEKKIYGYFDQSFNYVNLRNSVFLKKS